MNLETARELAGQAGAGSPDALAALLDRLARAALGGAGGGTAPVSGPREVAIGLNRFRQAANQRTAVASATAGTAGSPGSLGLNTGYGAPLTTTAGTAAGVTTVEAAGTLFELPAEYVGGAPVRVTARAHLTEISRHTATLTVRAHRLTRQGGLAPNSGPGGATPTGTAIGAASTSYADYAFDLTAANYSAGDIIAIFVEVALTTTAGTPDPAPAGFVEISEVKVRVG